MFTLKTLGAICIVGSVLMDLGSYWKQTAKTLKTKKSSQVSSTAYMLKIYHYLLSLTALVIFSNWAGFTMELAAFVFCLLALSVVARYKPRGWKLFS